MPVRLTLADSFLQNGLERIVYSLYLSIFLGVLRGSMTMLKPQFRCYFLHHFIPKVTAIISDNVTRDSEPGYNLIEYEEGTSITIGFNYRHGLKKLGKVVYDHDNVLIPPNRSWVSIHKIHPPLGEGTNGADSIERGWIQVHFPSEHLVGVTLLDRFDAIFKDRWPKITISHNFLGCHKPG
jgi:hypothetical protein